MSARPGRIRRLVHAFFNRREDTAVFKSPEFTDMVEHVWDMVRDEVDQAQRQGH